MMPSLLAQRFHTCLTDFTTVRAVGVDATSSMAARVAAAAVSEIFTVNDGRTIHFVRAITL